MISHVAGLPRLRCGEARVGERGYLVGVVRPGYLIGGDVLRPAMVAVAGR